MQRQAGDEFTAAQRRTAHAALSAIVGLDTFMIRFDQGEWKAFSKAIKDYEKAFPGVDMKPIHDIRRAFHALRSASSDLSADHLGGGKHKFIPRDRYPLRFAQKGAGKAK